LGCGLKTSRWTDRHREAAGALGREVWLVAEAPELLRLLDESYFELRTYRNG
jgi:hypothetical protein